MVKGVNRQIIEIRNTDNRYFERVLLFVRTGQSLLPKDELEQEAAGYLDEVKQGGEEGLPKLLDREYICKNHRLKLAVAILSVALVMSFAALAVLLLVYTKM